MVKVRYSSELYHHGILGQKWGIRRFQNPDGSLTPEGRKRYGRNSAKRPSSSQISRAQDVTRKDWSKPDMPDKVFSILGGDKETLTNVRKSYRDLYHEGSKIESDVQKHLVSKNGTPLIDLDTIDEQFTNDVPKTDRIKMHLSSSIAHRLTDASEPERSLETLKKEWPMGDIAFAMSECINDGYVDGDITAWSMWVTNKVPEKTLDAMSTYQKRKRKLWRENLDKIESGLGMTEDYSTGIPGRVNNNLQYTERKRSGIKGILAEDWEDFYKPNVLCSPKHNPAVVLSNEVIDKLRGVKDNNWWAIEPAMEELGYNHKTYSDMSTADWQKLVNKMNSYSEKDLHW